jgi:hypothetical protein
LRQLLAFPDDNTGKDIWNGVSQGLILYRIRLGGGTNFPRGFGTVEIAMRTTLEIPDALFRRAKSAAAEQGIPFCALVSEALAEKLRTGAREDKPWMKSFGKLRRLHKETARISRIIEAECGQIER